MTSKLTRERLLEIAEDGFLKHGESKELARMVLAATDSEPVAYMHDGEDGTEYNGHDEFSGGGKGIPLYRHAQPVPVVSADLLHTAASAIEDLLEHTDPNTSYYSGVWADVPGKLRAAMLQAQSDDDGKPTDDECIMTIEGILNCKRCGDEGWIVGEMGITRCACGQAGNSPAQSDCRPAQNHVSPEQNSVAPAQSPIAHGYRPECECSGCKATSRICAELAGNSPVIPDGYVMVPVESNGDMLAAAQDAYGETDGDIASTLRAAMLTAAPQEVR
ncbi:hypothetical protein MKR03_06735 [Klebsiella sp. K5-210]|uniref:hypothetical protein n=1 Tax=Klebsiella sp. K5-210 TaxID=2920194 RepID=UPI0024DE109A|nr:hypothetical protein [Klebsiella sp. K5-210]MDK1885853.1 hypothetical protein [Klebsiella sp. K5-210]